MKSEEKNLIVCYSHSGHNLKLGQEIQRKIGGEVFQLEDYFKKLKGGFLYFFGGMFGSLKIPSKVNHPEKEISNYSKVILLSPLWGRNITPAVRSFLKEYSSQIKNLFFVSVCGEGGKRQEKVLKEITQIYKRKPEEFLFISDEEFNGGKYLQKLNRFINSLI